MQPSKATASRFIPRSRNTEDFLVYAHLLLGPTSVSPLNLNWDWTIGSQPAFSSAS